MKNHSDYQSQEGLAMSGLQKSLRSLAVFAAVTLSPGQALADDTEIYYSNPESSNAASIVMVLDTSGSMETNECVEWNDAGSCIRRAKRMDELKTALFRVMDSLSGNVRMGIGRYNQNDGGRLVYPVRALDEVDFSGISEFTLLSDAADGDDAPGEGTDIGSRYENLPIGYDADGVMAFIFEDAQIPRYADVSAAYIQVTASQNSNDDIEFEYWYEDTPSSQLLNEAEIIGRPVPATTFKSEIDEDWSRNRRYRIDITDGVKAGLARADWCGGNNFGLFMTGPQAANGSDREIYMRDALREGAEAEYYAPRLIIEWDAQNNPLVNGSTLSTDPGYEGELACRGGMIFPLGSKLDDASDSGSDFENEETDNVVGPNRTVGLRFTRIPFDLRGSRPDVVNEAILHLQGDNNNKAFNLTVKAVPGDTEPFDPVPGYLKGLDTTTASETFAIAKGTFSGRFELDVTSVVNEVMSDPDWVEGGSITLLLTATENADIDAYDAGAAIAPILELNMSSPYMAKFVPRVRDKIKEAVAGLTAYGNTPSMESYAEMARYYLGENYRWARADIYTEVGMIGSGPQYDSPLSTASCDSNNIVLLTDGSPTNDADYRAVTDLTGFPSCNGGLNREGGSFNCQVQLAEWLYDGTQNGLGAPIATHTIAFTNDAGINANMARVSNAGNGLHRKGRNADELEAAFVEIINSVTVSNAAMAAPGVAVNQLNRFEFLDTLYYGLFKPSTMTRWEGNLKRYRADTQPVFDVNGDQIGERTQVVDETGARAVDPNNGFFMDTANSWWGMADDGTGTMVDTIDGSEVSAGGARQELLKQERRLFISLSEPGPGGAGQPATEWTSASQVSRPDLGLPGAAGAEDMETLYQWLKSSWGDPLHSPPVLITYDGPDVVTKETLDDPDALDNTVFVATNDGMVHAINARDGSEWFAWMPATELAKTQRRFTNGELSGPDFARATYGLDGGIGYWRKSSVGSDAKAEHVYLYVAQRRGGDKIFALDVSDRNQPNLMWVIDGGTGGTTGFQNLGQTWSTPVFSRISLDNGADSVPVIVFGGGYSDADHDTRGLVSTGDSIGNSLFIVHAETGAKLLEISNTGADYNNADMKWGVPSAPAVVDYDLDGGIDMIYFSDLGGQVFRVDMDPAAATVADSVERVQTLAKLGTSVAGGINNHRRFFASPSVAISTLPDGTQTFQVGLGSGYRSHPLDEQTQDTIYVLNDHDGYRIYEGGSPAGTTITRSDLFNVTSSPGASSFGWFLNLEPGEKVVSGGVFSGPLFIVASYVPQANAIDRCTNVIGASRLYVLGVGGGEGLADTLPISEGQLSGDDRYIQTALSGLPPNPQVFKGEKYTKVLLGTRFFETGQEVGGFEKTRWFQVFSETELMQQLQDSAMGAP